MKAETFNKPRERLIRLIHIAKRDLGLDDDTYRAILQRIGKKASAADLTVPELEKVLEHLKRSGFKVRSKTKNSSKKELSRPLAQDAESKKIRALWLFLHQIGVVKNPSEEALAAYVKRIVGVDALQWVNGAQALALIESLKKWAMRFLPAIVKQLAQEAQGVPMSNHERGEIAAAVGNAFNRLTFDPMHQAWERLTNVLQQPREGA